MRGKSYLFFLGLIAIIACSHVMNLTEKNFNETISNNKYVMVKFYAPWCGHCKTMAPEYQKLAELIKENGVVIGEVDATQQKQIGQAYSIQGFPTIKFFIDGVPADYKGARTADQMYGWIKKASQAVLEQISQQKIDQLKQKQTFVVYFGNNAQKRKVFELMNIIDSTGDYFVSPSDTDKVVLYSLGKTPIEYPQDSQFTVQQIKAWSMMNTIPTVVPLSSKQYLDWVFYDEATQKDVLMLLKEKDLSEEAFNNYVRFCENNKKACKCCYIQSNMQVYGGVKSYLKSKGDSVLALTKDGLKEAFTYPNPISELTQQSWIQFLSEVAQNKHPNLAGIENDNIQYDHVKSLTEDNFTSFIKENKVVFVEFYSPGCAHCVSFAQEYDRIAKKVYEDQTLDYEIVAIDAKKSQKIAMEAKVMGFPSFKVYLEGNPVTYEGPRTQQSIFKFIQTVKKSKPIDVGSIAQIPSPAVIIYDPAESSSMKLLPALFTRLQIYHLKEGSSPRVVLREQQEKQYKGEFTLEAVAKWLHKLTDPVLVNLLNPNIDNKLQDALQSRTHLLGLIDLNPENSQALTNTLEEYCKASTLVCGYAKKSDENFDQFTNWLGVVAQDSKLIYINTESYDKYIFNRPIAELSIQTLEQFVNQVKAGKIPKLQSPEGQTKQQKEQPKKAEAEEVNAKQSQQSSKQSNDEQSSSKKDPTTSEL